jgi:hypothetical protein
VRRVRAAGERADGGGGSGGGGGGGGALRLLHRPAAVRAATVRREIWFGLREKIGRYLCFSSKATSFVSYCLRIFVDFVSSVIGDEKPPSLPIFGNAVQCDV